MSQQDPVIEIKINPTQLKGRRGILCGLLGIVMITALLCLSLFAAKNNEINSFAGLGTDGCYLFATRIHQVTATLSKFTSSDPSICHYVVGGSTIVFLIMLVLLIETVLAACFAFAFTDHLIVILLRGSAVLVSLILMFCVSIIISAGVGTTCATWTNYSGLRCSNLLFPPFTATSYVGIMVASAIFSWITTSLLAVIMVLVGWSLRSRVNLSMNQGSLIDQDSEEDKEKYEL